MKFCIIWWILCFDSILTQYGPYQAPFEMKCQSYPRPSRIVYIMNETRNKIWIDCYMLPDFVKFNWVDLTIINRYNNTMLIALPVIYLSHRKTVAIGVYDEYHMQLDTRDYLFYGYDFKMIFLPNNTNLDISVNNTIKCVTLPVDRRINYRNKLDLVDRAAFPVWQPNIWTMVFYKSSIYTQQSVCVKCEDKSLNLYKKKCYHFNGNVKFYHSTETVFPTFLREYRYNASFVSVQLASEFPTSCILGTFTFQSSIILKREIKTGLYTIRCTTTGLRNPISEIVEIFVISDVPVVINPKQFQLNYSYINYITCSLIPNTDPFDTELYFISTNLSSTLYNILKFHMIIKITLQWKNYMNGIVYCFVCGIKIYKVSQCYYFMGFYSIKIKPFEQIIYLTASTVVTCEVYGQGYYERNAALIIPGIPAQYYKTLNDKSIIFNSIMELFCKYVCVSCTYNIVSASRCFTLLGDLTLICMPYDDPFNVFYYNPVIQLAFITNMSKIIYGSFCLFIRGFPFQSTGNNFTLSKNISANIYAFNCTMKDYNYSSTISINIINQVEQATITPIAGPISYMDNGTIICTAKNAYFSKFIDLSVNLADSKKVIVIRKNIMEIKKDFSLRNTEICFFCRAFEQSLAKSCYKLTFHIDFIYTPNRNIYYLYNNIYYIYARFYDAITYVNLTTVCTCRTCPTSIAQVGLFVTILSTAPDGTFEIKCEYQKIKFIVPFTIVTSHRQVIMKIIPDVDIIYTFAANTIQCFYSKNFSLKNEYMNFEVTYFDSTAYTKQNYVFYVLLNSIKYHNTTICFACNLDTVVSTQRCYSWKGLVKITYNPNKRVFYIKAGVNLHVNYIDLNNTNKSTASTCVAIIGPSPCLQSPDKFTILTTSMALGRYFIRFQMNNVNQYDYLNISILDPGILFFKSSLYHKVVNATHTVLLPNESIEISLKHRTDFPGLHFNWTNYHGITIITPTKRQRDAKNDRIRIEDTVISVTIKFGVYGYDYGKYTAIYFSTNPLEVLINYTIGNIPTHISMKGSFYVMFLDFINFTSNGFPPENILNVVNLKSQMICNRSTVEGCRLPFLSYFGFEEINITASLVVYPAFPFSYWTSSKISIRAFKTFDWRNPNKIIQYINNTMECYCGVTTIYNLSIMQLSGPSTLPTIRGNLFKIPSITPGQYKLTCILTVPGFAFVRTKVFQLYYESDKICFLPFAPIIGNLVKCISSQFPTKGLYKMIFKDIISNTVFTKGNNLLRIPYILSISTKYEIICQYSYNDTVSTISKDFSLKSGVKVSVFNENTCFVSESIPQEYDYIYDAKGQIFSNVRIYYLSNVDKDSQAFSLLLFLIYFLFQYPVFPFQIWIRKPTEIQLNNTMIKQTEYLGKRAMVRKLEELARKQHREKDLGNQLEELGSLFDMNEYGLSAEE